MLNHIVIHGRLTADPELKSTQSGVSVCRITVAVDRSFAKQGEEKQTDFFNVVFWRGLAEMVSKYFAKGKEILVSGEMQSRKWAADDGTNRTSWEIAGSTVDFCGSKSDTSTNRKGDGTTSDIGNLPLPDFGDDDLPF